MSSTSPTSQTSPPSASTDKRRKRIRHWTASDRQRHKSIEASRRQAFNERLLDLARLLPSLSAEYSDGSRVPSKHLVVDASIAAVTRLQADMDALRRELDAVKAQRDHWRDLATGGNHAGVVVPGPDEAVGLHDGAELEPGLIAARDLLAAQEILANAPAYHVLDQTAQQVPLWDLAMAQNVPVPDVYPQQGYELGAGEYQPYLAGLMGT